MNHADVLLVTVTKVESKAVMQVVQQATGSPSRPVSIDDRVYHDLGSINGTRVFMALSEMGTGGLGASLQAVEKGIDALSPAAVIMVGIAFGVNEKKQSIGDVLVSRQLWLYELQRVSADKIIPRGDKPHASPWLFNCFQSADLYWDESKAKVRFGLVLSGEKLVDNIDYRDQLKQFEPEAIGGDMEGAGLYVAGQDRKVDWILVKAICDWGDGDKNNPDKDKRQQIAAHNAASFVLHVLQQTPLKRDIAQRADLSGLGDLTGLGGRTCHSTLPTLPYFFGREKELAIIADAISPEARTWGVLIDGPGGIGKTALAIRAGHAASTEQFEFKLFLSAKVRELTPQGEQEIQDFMLPNYMALLKDLACEIGEDVERLDPNERAKAVTRALADKRTLIVIDNLETLEEKERVRVFQFLSRLPAACKAIVTSRRRADVDARAIRLDRLEQKDALALMAALAQNNRHLARATERERQELYEITNGNPLLIKWTAGQLGRGHCRTVAEACAFLQSTPKDNDPLEFIMGDLLDTFTESETAVLAALSHFMQPAKVKWIADLADLAERATQTALEDLADRALLLSDPEAQCFALPPLAAHFIRNKRPEVVAQTGNRLTHRAYALALENGYKVTKDKLALDTLETEWPTIEAALPRLVQGENERLQTLCDALVFFLNFSGRWDERLLLCQQAEAKALAANDFFNAGWRAYHAGMVYYGRGQAKEVLDCAVRCEKHWGTTFPKAESFREDKGAGAREKVYAIRLRCLGYRLEEHYSAAIEAYRKAMELLRTIGPESQDMAIWLNDLATAEYLSDDYTSAELDYREALRISRKINDWEGVAVYTGNLASLALDRGQWTQAEALAHEALELAEKIGRQQEVALEGARLARAMTRQGRSAEGLPYARRAVQISEKLRSPELEMAREVLKECEA